MSETDDPCPRCGGALEYDEADVCVGVIRGNPGCPACHWTPEPLVRVLAPYSVVGPAEVTSGRTQVDQRPPAEHVESFLRSATSPPQRAVADEIRSLRVRVLTLEGSVTASAAIDREERRAAERELATQTIRAEKAEAERDAALAAHKRALAAGPAALRDMGSVFLAEHVEAAQEAAMRGKA